MEGFQRLTLLPNVTALYTTVDIIAREFRGVNDLSPLGSERSMYLFHARMWSSLLLPAKLAHYLGLLRYCNVEHGLF